MPSTTLKFCYAVMMVGVSFILGTSGVYAGPLSFQQNTSFGLTDYSAALSGSLSEAADGSVRLVLTNNSGGEARITKVFVQDSVNILTKETSAGEASVVLNIIGENKIAVIKTVREITGLGLKEAKELVDSAPSEIATGLTEAEADDIRVRLETSGAVVSVNGSAKVVLESIGDKKVDVIKAVREITGLGLKEAKELVDSAPSEIAMGLTTAAAHDIRVRLETIGAVVSVNGSLAKVGLDILPGAIELPVDPTNPLQLAPDFSIILDYLGIDENPDLVFDFPFQQEFSDLLEAAVAGDLQLGLEISDSQGQDLYLVNVTSIPEPATLSLLLGGMTLMRRRKTLIDSNA